jgi:hypothetical protein
VHRESVGAKLVHRLRNRRARETESGAGRGA